MNVLFSLLWVSYVSIHWEDRVKDALEELHWQYDVRDKLKIPENHLHYRTN
jgi:hypothetical protein